MGHHDRHHQSMGSMCYFNLNVVFHWCFFSTRYSEEETARNGPTGKFGMLSIASFGFSVQKMAAPRRNADAISNAKPSTAGFARRFYRTYFDVVYPRLVVSSSVSDLFSRL